MKDTNVKSQPIFAVATRRHLNALLCSSAAVLLAACGASGTDDAASAAPSGVTQAAAAVQSDVRTAQDAPSEPNATDAAASAATTGAIAAADFSLTGYGGNAGDGAAPSASAPAPTRLLASVTSVATTPSEQVTALYQTLLGRAPDPEGLAFWMAAIDSGVSIDEVAAQIKASPEYLKLHPESTPVPTPGATVAIPATAYNYYVAANGSDTAAGTKAAPFKTLARAAKAATRAGTTVWVAPGTYAGGIKTTASGTSSARIYWVSTTKWGARIVPPASSTNNNAWDNRGNYVSIIGFDVDGTNSGSGTKWTHGIYTGGSYGMIADNHIHHVAKSVACTSAGGSAIGVDSYYHGVYTDVVSNVVNDIGPAGCTYVQGIYVSTSGTIKNNLVYRVGAVAIHLWHDANNVKIVNNTVTSSTFGMVIGGGDFYYTTAGADNVYVANNIVYDNKYGISEQGKTGTHNQYRNNLVYQNPSYNISLRNGLVATGTVSSNPLLVAYSRTATTPNFHLTSSSPAVGRGTSAYVHPVDLDGRPRNSTTGFDIGAYQH